MYMEDVANVLNVQASNVYKTKDFMKDVDLVPIKLKSADRF